MKDLKAMLCVLGLILTCAIAASAGDAPALTFKFTKANVPGATMTEPGGINNAGVSVGIYVDKGGAQHGYILNGKKVTKLDDPKAAANTTAGSNINPNGAISVVGTYTNKNTGATVGFLYKGGKFTDVPGPKGAIGATASAVNDSGEIVGSYADANGVTHGYLLKGKKYTTLDPPGSTNTTATGINKTGQVVMFWIDAGGSYESSLYNGKTYKTINIPGVPNSLALDLNAAGDVCYQWIDSGGINHGALLHAKKYYKFDYPKSTGTYGGGVNDMGNIIGGFQTSTGGTNWFGYIATYK